jgi:hypothetical protein
LLALPTPSLRYLWHNLSVRSSKRDAQGRVEGTQNVLFQVSVGGITEGKEWQIGLEFDYQNEDLMYCRPVGTPPEARSATHATPIAFLPPMSGLAASEVKLLPTTIQARIGEGRTAEVLRNLCYQIYNPEYPAAPSGDMWAAAARTVYGMDIPNDTWDLLTRHLRDLFGVTLHPPELNPRGELVQTYRDAQGNELDLSCAGRGLHQVLLLFSYLLMNRGAVLLLDEPDAHLEILRQRQVYNLLRKVAQQQDSQIIAASHSEVVLNEAAGREDSVIAFIGSRPHRINDRQHLLKSLTTIGFDQYYQAELRQWVLYLEGPSDLALLQAFAKRLGHPVVSVLSVAFVHYVATNLPTKARDHFYGLRECVPELRGVALFDRIEASLQQTALAETMWQRREIENYLFRPSTLLRFAEGPVPDLFSPARTQAMEVALRRIVPEIARENLDDPYWHQQKASEQLERVLTEYYRSQHRPIELSKGDYATLVGFMDSEEIDQEVIEKLDLIYQIAQRAEGTAEM